MESAQRSPGQLVVTGSSAGGIEALSVLLRGLPADFGAPIVVAQHLDPRVPSSLAAILAKQTVLRVVAVENSARLEPSTVYVVPADRHVEVSADAMRVHDGSPDRPKPSIDLLFASAAGAFGDRLIAIVLTGMGSDGSAGARAVKAYGGTVIIEDPATASFSSMPASLESSMVDVVAPLDRIADELLGLIDDVSELPDESAALSALLERVRTTSKIDFSHYKLATIKRRLGRQLALTGQRTIAEYAEYLTAQPAEFERLIASFLIKVTEFFRDAEFFSALRETIVPELIAAARRDKREVRIWSAGCATGEEAYSLAMTVAEALRADPEPPAVRIFATDIDDAAISFARRGVYPRESVAALDPQLVQRYFIEHNGGFEIAKQIRGITVFGRHDLGQRAPFPRMDLAVCRNVLIYFSKELQARTLQVFAFSLRTGGYLALGKAETANPIPQSFNVVNAALRIFRRYGERVAIPAAPVQKPAYRLRDVDRTRHQIPASERVADGRVTINEKLGSFLTTSSIGVLLVDRHYDIVSINPSARAMFDIHGAAVGEDLVHLTPPRTAGQIKTMLDRALRNQQPTAGGEEITVGDDGGATARFLSLSCYPEIANEREVTGAIILAADITDVARERHEAQRVIELQTLEIENLRRLQSGANERQRSLVAANAELAHVNSELRAHNDALIINAEEAEAATEEVETLNEEMQATNEELETLNEEFAATIEELNTTNDEHHSRGLELQDQLGRSDERRQVSGRAAVALAALVDALPLAIAAVDATGVVVAANGSFRDLQSDAIETAVQIDDDAGATIAFSVVFRRAGDGHAFTFTYRSIAADQSVTIYAGDVRPIGNSDDARSIIELKRIS